MASSAAELAARLEDRFSIIERERMADVPILNPALKVEAVGFRPWGGEFLGVLVTPWFMNLMLVPAADEAADDQDRHSGDTSTVAFPAAEFEFIRGEEAGIGGYRLCSLFSPVVEFEDHAAAVATAESVLEQLMMPADDAATDAGDGPAAAIEDTEPRARAVSRRDLFRGLARQAGAGPA